MFLFNSLHLHFMLMDLFSFFWLPALTIESIKPNDAQEHRRRIDYRRARIQHRSIQLKDIKEVVITDEFGQRLRDVAGPYNEGAHLTLICEAGGVDLSKAGLRWYKDGHLYDETWNITAHGIIRNELVMTLIKRSDLMTMLTCIANYSNLTKSVSTNITLNLNLRPTSVRIISQEQPLLAEEQAEFKCKSEGSRPSAIITWWKGSKRLQYAPDDVISTENSTISTVHFTPMAEDNGKSISCRADHSILPDSAIDDSRILNVHFAPKLSLSIGSNLYHDQVRELSDVTFECHVISNPPISSVSWQFNEHTLSNNDIPWPIISFGGLIFRNHSLTIKGVTRHQAGGYRCSAVNVVGDGYSREINLRILYSPVCASNQKTVYGSATKEPIKVPCTVEANPPQVNFRWALNNSISLIPIKSFDFNRLTSVATYAPRTKFGYGQLYCWANNFVGEQTSPCIFDVVPADLPETVQNCLVSNQSMNSLVIRCEPGQDGGIEQSFHLEVYHSITGSLYTNLTSTSYPTFEVTSLPKGSPLLLLLYAANSKGRSNSVALTASTLPIPNREIGIITPVIAALTSVIGSLVFIAIAIMIIAQIRIISAKKETEPHQSRSNSSSPFHELKLNGKATMDILDEETSGSLQPQNYYAWSDDINEWDAKISSLGLSDNGFDISNEKELPLDQKDHFQKQITPLSTPV